MTDANTTAASLAEELESLRRRGTDALAEARAEDAKQRAERDQDNAARDARLRELEELWAADLARKERDAQLAAARERWSAAQAAYTPVVNDNACALEAWQKLPELVKERLVVALDAYEQLKSAHADLRAAWFGLDQAEPGSAGPEPQLSGSPIPVANPNIPGGGLLHEIARNDRALTARLNTLNR